MTPMHSNESAEEEWAPTLARAANLAAELAPRADQTEEGRQVRDEAMLFGDVLEHKVRTGQRERGRPSRRSPMMSFWISEVPARMVSAREWKYTGANRVQSRPSSCGNQ